MSTLTKASIYELQGYKSEALDIYKDILRKEPHNKKAREAIERISGIRKKYGDVNEEMKEFFINMKSDIEIKEFERWLSKIWN